MSFEIIDINTIFGPWPIVRAEMPVDRLILALNSHGVAKSVAISTVGVLHSHNDGNAETLRLCSDKDQLMPAATIDPRGYFGPAGMLAKIKEQGFKLLRFFPVFQEWSLDHSVFLDILDENEFVGLPLMVHMNATGSPTALAKNLSGRNSRIILQGISFENMAEAVSVMRKHSNLIVEISELRVPGALRFLVDQVGADRVVFGSACLKNSMAAALGYVTDSDVSDENKEKILGGNIKLLLGG